MDREIVLSGARVALAIMTEADQPYFQRWLSENAELRHLIDDHRIPTWEDQKKWFARAQQPDRKFFSLVALSSGELIGNGGFVDIDPAQKSATLRITIGSTAHIGQGLGSEAVTLMVRYAFEIAGWERIDLQVLTTNVRAIRSYEKSGFESVSQREKDGKTIVTMSLQNPGAGGEIKRGTVPCSVMMYVRNGGPRFLRCVQSCLALRDHVVLDGGSTDGTIEIAKKYGCRVLPQDPRFLDGNGRIVDFGAVATQAYKATNEEWVALLAADEELNGEFIDVISRVIQEGKRGAYLVDRFFVIDGRMRKYFSTKHNRQMRFCDTSSVLGFTKAVHERPVYAPGVVPQVLEGGYQYLPLLETPEELKEKYRRYLSLDRDRLGSLDWSKWTLFTLKRFAILTMMLLRIVWIRIVHDSRDCVPWPYEKLNLWYGWQLIKRSCPAYRRA